MAKPGATMTLTEVHARLRARIHAWWDSVPPDNRKAEYPMSFFIDKFGASTGRIGTALRQLHWTRLAQRMTEEGNIRRWVPPGTPANAHRPVATAEMSESVLKRQIEDLRKQIKAMSQESVTDEFVKKKIFGLKDTPLVIPSWMIEPSKSGSAPGVPTIFASDWHWGEVVFPKQIGGVNTYNLAIAHERAKTLINRTIDLLNNHVVNPNYPGIVLALGGDMVSGDLHEELEATNEMECMAVAVDIIGVLIWCIKSLKERFKRVFVPCVTGNHGRLTKKVRAKGRNFTSVDWLIYMMLRTHFENDAEVTFYVPDGSDALYRIYNHRYLLSHGDQYRGGDSLIGCLGPITRGDHKKRSRNMQIGMEYDTQMMGHWHQLIQLQRLIVNGSLKGYDEYAYTSNFPYEVARQALWLTHPQYGITISMPVLVDPQPKKILTASWVSVPGRD